MSASLVGSEMCIRDRRRAELPTMQRSTNGGTSAEGHRQRSTCRGAQTAVSYTHLTLPTICSV
eukprot:3640448-Alexandrium_andersonii.AAC.1